jgi:hypothetical protein
MDFLVTFVGHIDVHKKPDGFPVIQGRPGEVHDLVFIRSENKEGIVNAVNTESLKYIRYQGMSVRRDPYAHEDPAKIDTDRMFVPMHMLTYISAEVKLIQGQPEEPESTGLAAVKN